MTSAADSEGITAADPSARSVVAAFETLTYHAAKELAACIMPRDEGTTPGEFDFCPVGCGGALVPRQDGRPGRYCGACLTPEPLPLVRVRMPNGTMRWMSLDELAERYR